MGEGTSCVDSARVREEGGIDQSLGFVDRRKQVGRIVTTGQLSLCSEEQSPQPGITRSLTGVVVDGEISGPSEPRVEAIPQPPSASPKRKRDLSSDSEDDLAELWDPEPEPVWSVETLCGLRMKLKRQRVSTVRPEHHKVFARLLEDPVVKKFLAWDKMLRVSDKYLLSMVIAYFSRAGLFSWQFRPIHFFLALYLANDMEEDNQAPKQDIFYFLYGKSYAQRPMFHKLRFQLIRSMGWRIWVSREECEEIQAYNPELWVWARDRTNLNLEP
ncbi:speedy protein E4A-like [Peromyscus leucopus]|uniref:speedy protein E4A-like n=1 Tax=Peromyscus leucopus TaxID=10041 RepID=UPI001884CADB|nr:speedy protein E4A-like [Peromyscus leucopus]